MLNLQVFQLNILCEKQCKEDVGESAGTAMRFTTENKYQINCSLMGKCIEHGASSTWSVLVA